MIVLQVLLALRWHDPRSRPLHLSPHEGQTRYRVFVTLGTDSLSPEAIERRYHLPRRGELPLTPEAVRDIVRHVETAGRADGPAFVRLHTRHNGEPEQIWLWPES